MNEEYGKKERRWTWAVEWWLVKGKEKRRMSM
jgi:hypothetical protein